MVKPGDEVFIIQSNRYIKKCTVISTDDSLCVVKFEEGGAIRVRHSRLFFDKDIAENFVKELIKRRGDIRSPYCQDL